MGLLSWIVTAVCVLADVAAVVFLVRGLRSAPKRFAVLSLCAGGVTVVIGLVGTVLGLGHAFSAVASVDPSRKATLLAEGISEAMNATAFGLGACVIPFAVAVVLLLRRSPPAQGGAASASSARP